MSQFSKVSALLKLQGNSLTSIKYTYTYTCVCVCHLVGFNVKTALAINIFNDSHNTEESKEKLSDLYHI